MLRYVRVTDILDDGTLGRDEVGIRPRDAKGYELEPNDLLFARSGSVGKTYLYDPADGPCAHAGYVIRFPLDPALCDPRFVAQFTRSTEYWAWVRRTLRQGAQPNINAREYGSIAIPYPLIEEQSAIAGILDEADALIHATASQVVKLKRLRVGTVRRLFVGPTDTGLPEGWWWEPLKSVGDVITGRTPPAALSGAWDGDTPFVTPGDVGDEDRIDHVARSLTERGARSVRIVPRDSLLVVCIGATIGKLALAPEACATNQQINAVVAEAHHSPVFLAAAVASQRTALERLAGLQAIPLVNKSQFGEMLIPMASPSEQRRVAAILNVLDRRIEVEQRYLGKLRLLKAGLSTQLFSGVGVDSLVPGLAASA